VKIEGNILPEKRESFSLLVVKDDIYLFGG
jgi:hypothetical protein